MDFSIIIPTYNRSLLIKQTINSCLNQEYLGLYEIIIVDDGSTDDTEIVIKNYNSPLIKYYKKENEERGKARNFGVQQAKGNWVTFLDSDDIILPHHLSSAKKFIENNAQCKVFHQGFEVKDIDNNILLKSPSTIKNVNKSLLNGNVIGCIGVFLHASIFDQHQFNEDRKFINGEDWILWLQISKKHQWYFNPDVTAYALHHDKRSTFNFNEESLNYSREKIREMLEKDSDFMQLDPNIVSKINAHMLSYTSLRAVMSKNKTASLKYLKEAVLENHNELFKKRTLAIIKLLIFH